MPAPTPNIITLPKFERALRAALMADVAWTRSISIKDGSFIYQQDHERTDDTADTAHFGLVKHDGATLRRIFIQAFDDITSNGAMDEERILSARDKNTRTYRLLVQRLHLRINVVLETHTWRLIRLAYSDMGLGNTENFRLHQKIRRFATDDEVDLFDVYLSNLLVQSLPKLISKNPIVTPTAKAAMFKAGNTFRAMNHAVLGKVVKGRGV